MKTPSLKVGVIGAGVGLMHLEAYATLPNVKIIALAGLNDIRVEHHAKKFNIPYIFNSYAELINMPEIDAVSVCVPNNLHAPISIAALAAGKHVLVEKPLASTLAEGQAMLAAANANKRILMVAFNYRYRGDVQWLKQYIQSGELGNIYYAKAFWMRRAGIPGIDSWFVNKTQSGGGALIDLGVHVLDIVMYLLDEPTVLTVSASTYEKFGSRGLKGWDLHQFTEAHKEFSVEDLATALMRLDNNATLILDASWATHGSAKDDFGITLFGTEGGAELFVRHYAEENTVLLFKDVHGVMTDLTPHIPKGKKLQSIIENFIAAITLGTPAIPSAEEGLKRLEIIDACYRSALTNQEIVL